MIDDVDRGANDSDWQPAETARKIAFAEDGSCVRGAYAAGIVGIRKGTDNSSFGASCRCPASTRRRSPKP